MPVDSPQPATGGAWRLRPGIPAGAATPAHRPVRVAGLQGYLDPIGVAPGGVVRIHLSAPATHTIAVARLGRSALLLPEPDDAADRAEARTLSHLRRAAADRHDVHPGSYARIDGPGVGRPATVSAWVRVWHLPATVETSSWAAVVSDMDYPERCCWALGIDADGHPGCYVGDGDHHDRRWWCFARSSLLDRRGQWVHLAFRVEDGTAQLWVDGGLTGEGAAAPLPAGRLPATGPVRIAAAAESGLADHFLDGDVSAVTLFARPLARHDIVALAEDRAVSLEPPAGRDRLLAHWPLRERSGRSISDLSGHNRHGTLENCPTLNLPGPSASPAIGRPGYDPDTDPTRGGCIRFASDDLVDCGWPVAAEVTVPPDAESGTYYVRATLEGAEDEPLEMPFVVVRTVPRRAGAVALLYATFTWTTYARRPTDGVCRPRSGLVRIHPQHQRQAVLQPGHADAPAPGRAVHPPQSPARRDRPPASGASGAARRVVVGPRELRVRVHHRRRTRRRARTAGTIRGADDRRPQRVLDPTDA